MLKLASDEQCLYMGVSDQNEGWETCLLEPVLPEAIPLSQIDVPIISSVLLAVIAPFASMMIISLLGFTGGGIASGSIAAGMMSSEAIALGGGVAAGGLVATLQSIGAAGLGVVGSIVTAVGAVIINIVSQILLNWYSTSCDWFL